jgi:hypothetical protein
MGGKPIPDEGETATLDRAKNCDEAGRNCDEIGEINKTVKIKTLKNKIKFFRFILVLILFFIFIFT